jgi:hypothetical protein
MKKKGVDLRELRRHPQQGRQRGEEYTERRAKTISGITRFGNRGTHGDSSINIPPLGGSSQEAPASSAAGARRRERVTSRAEQELAMIEPFEPLLVKAARSIFGASYDYKRRYLEFKAFAAAQEKAQRAQAKSEKNERAI